MKIFGVAFLISAVACEEGVEVLRAIQKYREKLHLKPLVASKELTDTARDRTEAIIGSNNLFNQSADIWTLSEKNGFRPRSIGENIGKSVNKDKNGMDIFQEWINSPVHKENIVDTHDYTHVGVYKLLGENNVYISAVFGRSEKEMKSPDKETKKDSAKEKKQKHDKTKATSGEKTAPPQPQQDELEVRSTRHIQTAQEPDSSQHSPKHPQNYSTGENSLQRAAPASGSKTPDTQTPQKTSYNSNSNPPTPASYLPLSQPAPQPPISLSKSTATLLLSLPESLQRTTPVIKLVIVKDNDLKTLQK